MIPSFLCFTATQLARQLHQEHTQVVCSYEEARKRLAQRHSAMDLGHMNVVLKWMYLYVGSIFRLWNVVLK